MNPKAKAMLVSAAYGTAGGALLGTASLAFGTSGRSVAKGASLGLYAGILFGSYIIISHAYSKHKQDNPDGEYYPDTPGDSPYGEFESEGGGEEAEGAPQLWNPTLLRESIGSSEELIKIGPKPKRPELNFYVPVFSIAF